MTEKHRVGRLRHVAGNARHGLYYTVDGGDRIAISFGVASRQEVDEIMERAKESGAQIVKEAEENAFAGYSGVFRDPFGNRWPVGFNVEFPRKK